MRWRRLATEVLAAGLIAGCGGGPSHTASNPAAAVTATPASTATAASSSTTAIASCSAADVLRETDALLAGETFDAHYLTIAGQLTLSVWLMAPEIDPAAAVAALPKNNRMALERGLLTFDRIAEQIPCATRVFAQLNPMIVDTRYEAWYIDFLPARVFAGLHDPSVDELVAALDRAGKTVAEGRTKTANQRIATGTTCDWPSARTKIQPSLGSAGGNTTAYLIVGGRLTENRWDPNPPDDVDVEVQWTVEATADAADDAILERLGHVAQALACLRTPVDLLEAFIVDRTGRLVVYAKVNGPAVRSGQIPLPRDGAVLDHEHPGSP